MQTVIVHLDMNSYFASVIQQDNPEYRGKPLGVCEHLGGIIIGASKEAKKWGITTGTPVWEARKLYPKIILTHTTAERFRFYTRRLIKLVSEFTGEVEVYSIDEVFLDITRVCNVKNVIASRRRWRSNLSPFDRSPHRFAPRDDSFAEPFSEAVNIAKEIKRRMRQEVGDWLTCSMGIAENKLLAKIGSDLKKPDGIVVIKNSKSLPRRQAGKIQMPNQIINPKSEILNLYKDELYYRLKLTDIPGIGSRQEKNLNQLGIKTLLDLKNYPKSLLFARFGRIMGHHLYSLGQLESTWKTDVRQDEGIKSMGHMYTLPKEYRHGPFFLPVLYKLCEMVGKRLRQKKLEGNLIHFYIRDKDYQGFGESKKIGDYICDGREIFIQAADIYADLLRRSVRGSIYHIKLIGVTMANLRSINGQLSLFGHRERGQRLVQALDKINEKYGNFTITRVPVLAAGKVFRDSAGFGRVKEL